MNQHRTSQGQLYRSEEPPESQRDAFTGGDIPVAVYGLGKMGLPLAAAFADVTGNVVGVDVDETRVGAINEGRCPVEDEPGLDEAVSRAVGSGALSATADSRRAARAARVHVVIVPTLLEDGEPDLSAVEAVSDAVGAGLQPGDLVLVESTLPPGTCRGVVQPTLTDVSGLAPDAFGLAFCPERTASGSALRDIRGSYPKVVGGRDEESVRVATLVYGEITDNDVLSVGTCTAAECVKLFEGVYRDVNIALANELARLAEELPVDVREAIDVANTQPYCDIHTPGPGVGGHCIPYYPRFLTETTETALPLVNRARETNEMMPAYTADILTRGLEEIGVDVGDASVALLGVTYRPGVDETRESPAGRIASILSDTGVDVYLTDPVCSDFSPIDGTPVTLDLLSALDLDGLVVVTAHEEFHSIPWEELEDVVVVDGRQLLDREIPHPVYTIGGGWDGHTDDSSPVER
jgi:UDP-N-acetyl-D-mannosaminuronic acid dehydrogenase